jgi:hypothetical protein
MSAIDCITNAEVPVPLETQGNRKARPQDALRYDMDLPLRGTFYPLGYPVEVKTNDPNVLIAATESFGHRGVSRDSTPLQIHVGVSGDGGETCPLEPTRREYNHLYSLVADVHNQALLDLKTCTSFAWINQSALQNRLYFRYNFLEKMVYLLLGASLVTDIHAACVSKYERGLLLCGDSGAGKSTLAYACARAGWTYTSDDTSYLINDSPEPRVIGHSHRIRFRPAARALFPELADCEITPRMEGKPSIEVTLDRLPVLHASAEANVRSVIYLNRTPSSRAKLVSLPAGTATERMKSELFSAGEIRTKHEQMLDVFSKVPTYELQYSDLDDAILQLDRLTGAMAP